ncbi:MAG: LacI family DNA-binding transcriptional regulator [Bifidobacterium sp.]|jgi:LacI family transcriptional regulator|nr:LacI family DNA-binding transcriptional regulator [Bifidobacterium sp.]
MTTMKEIARKTGVSTSTVSLVLNGRDRGRVKSDIAKRVRAAAETMGYRPNPLARSLRTSRTRMLGFVSDEIATTPYAGGIILGAQDAARSLGYMMLTVNTDERFDEDGGIAALERYGVDGFMYATMYHRTVDVPRSLCGRPLVLVDADARNGGVPGIVPDEFHIGYDATRRLVDAGCSRIAYVGSRDRIPAQTGRRKGYRQALDDAGMPYDPRLDVAVTGNQPAVDDVDSLMERFHPDGFFCFNDAHAWYVYECAARRGMRVGRDVSVVGVDNHRVFAQTLAPRLTTVALPHYEMGFWAVCTLVSRIEGVAVDVRPSAGLVADMPQFGGDGTVAVRCALVEKDSVAHRS